MSDFTTAQCVLFNDIFRKPVTVTFDRENASSDGGAVLLKAADNRLGLIDRLAACLDDPRQPGKVVHDLRELLSQRVFAIACGYPDGNDAARLANDPIQKLLVGRDPVSEEALASQPTLSRFENSISRKELYRFGETLAETVIEHHHHRLNGKARWITVDLDPTADPTHGTQQLAFFNGFYDSWCYLPVVGFLSFDDEKDQHLVTAVLRPGNSPDKRNAVGILKRIIERLQVAFPESKYHVRLDAGFACPEVFDFLESEPNVFYTVAMARNSVLARKSRRLLRKARRLSKRTDGTARVYGEFEYAARKWPGKRRIIVKAEVLYYPDRTPKDNLRFVVTNLFDSPQTLYEEIYCERGDVENRIKELQHGLSIGRTSCSKFWANQFRVLVTAAAYVLMQEIRRAASHTALAGAQVSTLREHLMKLGAEVVQSTRRIVIHLPASFPFIDAWNRIACSLDASTG